jgi:hypothetical protein
MGKGKVWFASTQMSYTCLISVCRLAFMIGKFMTVILFWIDSDPIADCVVRVGG